MNPLSKEEFLEKLKIDREFNSKYGRKHITEGKMVLPPCHYGFQVYTRELSLEERATIWNNTHNPVGNIYTHNQYDENDIPTRAISLMWNQRSVDTFLGLPFNIASYGLLLEIIAKEVNMVPDQLIGNLGDTHLYLNHIEQAKEQIGRELSDEELYQINPRLEELQHIKISQVEAGNYEVAAAARKEELDILKEMQTHTRQPYALPKLIINTEFWQTESGECGVGLLKTNLKGLEISDFSLENYQSHATIKAPLSN